MVLVVLLFPINSSMSVGESRQSPWKSYANAVANIRRSTPLKLCQISDFLCVSPSAVDSRCPTNSVLFNIGTNQTIFLRPFSWFLNRCASKIHSFSKTFFRQEKAIFIWWNIELSITLVNDWISKRVVHFEVVSCILSSYSKAWPSKLLSNLSEWSIFCAEQSKSARKWCREGVVKLEKSLNFLSSLEWQLSLFLLMLGVRVASEASESAAVEAVFYGRSSRFPTDVNSRLSNHGELRSTRCVLSSAVKSTSLARRKRES